MQPDNIYDFLRKSDGVKKWKEESFKAGKKKCYCSQKTKDLEIHHTISFSKLVRQAIDTLGFDFSTKVADYTPEQLLVIELKLEQLHNKIGPGIILSKRVHSLFHTIYGSGADKKDLEQFKKKFFSRETLSRKKKKTKITVYDESEID